MTGKKSFRRGKLGLTAQDITFCQHYFQHGNATDAILATGAQYADRMSAGEMASRKLKNIDIRAYLDDLKVAASEAAKVTVEELARGFARAVNADITELMDDDGQMKPPREWPERIRLAITKIEVEDLFDVREDGEGGRRKVKVGAKWKVWLENKTECRKVLAQWKRMIGPDSTATDQAKSAPLTINGQANPDAL